MGFFIWDFLLFQHFTSIKYYSFKIFVNFVHSSFIVLKFILFFIRKAKRCLLILPPWALLTPPRYLFINWGYTVFLKEPLAPWEDKVWLETSSARPLEEVKLWRTFWWGVIPSSCFTVFSIHSLFPGLFCSFSSLFFPLLIF